MVKVAKEEGVRVSAEVCPHHFTLSTDDMKEADTNYKMNPPLRTKEDVKALREGLQDGIMEVISTDHAPHTFEDKNRSMQEAPFGIVGLETAEKQCTKYTYRITQMEGCCISPRKCYLDL